MMLLAFRKGNWYKKEQSAGADEGILDTCTLRYKWREKRVLIGSGKGHSKLTIIHLVNVFTKV